MKREGVKRMIGGGVLFFLVAPAIFVAVLLIGVGKSVADIAGSDPVQPGGTAQLEAGQKVSLLVFAGTATGDGATQGSGVPAPDETCTVTDPTGQPANLTRDSGTEVSDGGQSYREGYTLTAGPAGAYTITCGSSEVLVVDENAMSELGRNVGGTLVAALVIPFVVGIIGLALFIWGLVKFNRSKKAMPAGGYGQGQYAYGQQQYGQPGYGGGQQPYAGQDYPQQGQQSYDGGQLAYGSDQQYGQQGQGGRDGQNPPQNPYGPTS